MVVDERRVGAEERCLEPEHQPIVIAAIFLVVRRQRREPTATGSVSTP
jgi:hypothetical protein